MRAADVMNDSRDEAIRLAAFEAFGAFSKLLVEFRDCIHNEDFEAELAERVVKAAQAACIYLAPALQEPVNRALGIIDAREELAEVFASRRYSQTALEQELNILVATMIVRDLCGMPAKRVWPTCACGEQNKDVRHWDYPVKNGALEQCWSCYSKSRTPAANAPASTGAPF